MTDVTRFPSFEEKTAQGMIRVNNEATSGVPTYLGVRVLEFGPGRLLAEVAVRDELLTPFGTLHGGAMAALVDHVLGCVLYPLMTRGQWAATTEFKLNYLAPVKTGTLRAESTVVSLGRRSAVVRVDVENEGRAVCTALGTLMISDPPSAPRPPDGR